MPLITREGDSLAVGFASFLAVCVCLCVCTVQEKRLCYKHQTWYRCDTWQSIAILKNRCESPVMLTNSK